jgi:hypothetical protein
MTKSIFAEVMPHVWPWKTTNAGLSPSSPRPAAQSMLFLNPMSPLKPTLTLGQGAIGIFNVSEEREGDAEK